MSKMQFVLHTVNPNSLVCEFIRVVYEKGVGLNLIELCVSGQNSEKC